MYDVSSLVFQRETYSARVCGPAEFGLYSYDRPVPSGSHLNPGLLGSVQRGQGMEYYLPQPVRITVYILLYKLFISVIECFIIIVLI